IARADANRNRRAGISSVVFGAILCPTRKKRRWIENKNFKMKSSTYLKNLQLSTNWRAQYNPLRGLTIAQLVTMLEAAERGNYARLQWLYRFVEKRNPTLRAVLQRRQAALTRLDWDIRFRETSTTVVQSSRTLAARQAAVLREAYEQIGNLREAV